MVDLSMVPDEQGVILIEGEGFGWEWKKYNDAMSKARYCFYDIHNKYRNNDEPRYRMLMDVIKEQTGAIAVVVGKESEYGGIDHQSQGTSSTAYKSKSALRNFIFNKNSWLFTGNDNEQMAPDFKAVPVFKNGKEEKPVFKYEFSLEGCLHKPKLKFKNKPTFNQLLDAIHHVVGYANWTNGKFNFGSWSSWENHFKFSHFTTGKASIDTKNKRIMLVSDLFDKEVDKYADYDSLREKKKATDEDYKQYNKRKADITQKLIKEANPDHVMYLSYYLTEIDSSPFQDVNPAIRKAVESSTMFVIPKNAQADYERHASGIDDLE